MSTVSRRSVLYALGVLGLAGTVGLFSRFRPVPSTRGSDIASPPCARSNRVSETQLRMGTYLTITACHRSRLLLDEAMAAAFNSAARAESILTRHATNSPLGVLNTQAELRDAPAEVTSLLQSSLILAQRTGNAFNPAVMPVLEAMESYGVSSANALPSSVSTDVRRLSDPSCVRIEGCRVRLRHAGMGVSLDGIAKGHIVDLVASSLLDRGITSFLIDAGGDMRVGPELPDGIPWRIGIQDADYPARNIMTVLLKAGAIATSGNYESLSVRGYEHLVPMQQKERRPDAPVCTSVSVTAPTCLEADSLATALFAMGIERGAAFMACNPAYSCLWQTSEGRVLSSEGKTWAQPLHGEKPAVARNPARDYAVYETLSHSMARYGYMSTLNQGSRNHFAY